MSLIAQKLISASGATEETDDDFNLVTGLYHFDGSNGAQNNTFLDSSSNGFTVTRAGSTTQGTFSPFSAAEGKWSIEFDGSVYCSSATSDDFEFGTGDYTIEAWVWKNTTGQQHVYDGRWPDNNERILFYVNSADKLAAYIDGTVKGAATSDFPLNQWVHIALTRSGTTGYLFQNGSQVATWTGDSVDIEKPPYSIFIGRDSYGANYYWNGFMSNIRVLKGTAAYTGSSYSVPTSPLTAITNTKLLTARMNRFIDSSTSAHVMTNNGIGVTPFSPFAPSSSYSAGNKGGSGYFDGSGDYLSVPNHADLKVGSSDFTLEAWAYIKSTANNEGICGLYTTTGNQRSYIIYQTDSTNHFGVAMSSDGTYESGSGIDSGVDISGYLNSWVHLALTKSGTNATLYLNGTSIGTTSSAPSTLYASTSPFYVGTMYGASADFDGYIANVRLVKGSIVYASNFTPPTAPLTAITNTEVLFNFTNAAMFDQSGKTNVETVGNAQLDTSVKKLGTASLELDNSGDYLPLSQSSFVPLGSGDFTIECFVRFSTVASSGIFQLSNGTLNATTRGPAAGCSASTGKWGIYYGTTWYEPASSQVPSTNTWYHVAFVRNSGTSKLYIDGTEMVSASDSTNYTDTYFTIGGWYSTSYLMHGYIDEFRISLKARYTSNFTAPTEEFANR